MLAIAKHTVALWKSPHDTTHTDTTTSSDTDTDTEREICVAHFALVLSEPANLPHQGGISTVWHTVLAPAEEYFNTIVHHTEAHTFETLTTIALTSWFLFTENIILQLKKHMTCYALEKQLRSGERERERDDSCHYDKSQIP